MFDPVVIYAVASLIVFLFGVVGGWLITRHGKITRSSLQTAVAILVAIVWVVSIGAEIIIPAYTVSVVVHGIMGAVVGYLFSDDGVTINIGNK